MNRQSDITLNQQWIGDSNRLKYGEAAMKSALDDITRPLFVVEHRGDPAFSHDGGMIWGGQLDNHPKGLPLL
ncbi:MAG: hypothetical protein PVH22_03795, partial [Desulfobacteraceae bacterium]